MDIYLSSILLGGLGLGAMAAGGLSVHGHAGGGHGHVGDGHAGHAPGAHGHAHVSTDAHGHTNTHASSHSHEIAIPQSKAVWLLSWPRIMFGFLLGMGAVGLATQDILREPFTLAAAVAGGLFFQRFIITPLWNFSLRFASTPAVTSEGVDEATAVTSFNANGEGLVAIEVDGQIVQVLGRLGAADRTMGAVVRAGQRLRVDEVNTSNNRCTVSVL